LRVVQLVQKAIDMGYTLDQVEGMVQSLASSAGTQPGTGLYEGGDDAKKK
jgi:hypothetical protein